MEISLETPALLFSATSLILLAYTNRFLTIANIVRNLKAAYDKDKNQKLVLQIRNLNLRVSLIRYMQLAGVFSLFFGALSMLELFLKFTLGGLVMFGLSLLFLMISLVLSAWEISISVNALKLHLDDLEDVSFKELHPKEANHSTKKEN